MSSFEEERVIVKELKNDYKLLRKQSAYGIIAVLAALAIVSLLIWALVEKFKLEKVAWSQAFTAVLSLGAAIIAYRQWIAARHETSIDKYYDRIDIANKRLEALYTTDEAKKDMHIFVQLDKLEYVIIKYSLGYMNPLLTRRAIMDFKGHCENTEFCTSASYWVTKAAYLPKTREVATLICVSCKINN